MTNEFEEKLKEKVPDIRAADDLQKQADQPAANAASSVGESKTSHTHLTRIQNPFSAGNDSEALTFLHQKRETNFLDWLFQLERVFIPEIDRKISLESSRSAEEITGELARCPKGLSDKFPEIRVKVKGDKFSIASSEAPWLASISPTLQGFITQTDEGSKICLRVSNSGLLATTANAPLAALLATLLSFMISSYLLPHPILLFYSLICTLPLPLLGCVAAIAISEARFKKELPRLLAGVRKLAESSQPYVDSEEEIWLDMPARNAVMEKVIAGGVSGLIYLLFAFGLHAQAWNHWVAGEYEKCAALCEPVEKLAEAVLGKDDTTVADCKYYLAETHRCLGHTEQAIKLYAEAEKPMAAGLGADNNFYADVLYNIGRCYEDQGKFAEAKEKYLRALKIWQKAFGKRNMICSKGLNRLAAISLKMGQLGSARDFQEQGIEIDRAYGKEYAKAEAADLNELSAIDIREGNFEQAVKDAEDALKAKQEVNDAKIALVPTYINLARAYMGVKDQTKANDAFKNAISNLPGTKIGESELSLPGLKILSKDYARAARKQQQRYEVPNFDTRADITYEGDGWI